MNKYGVVVCVRSCRAPSADPAQPSSVSQILAIHTLLVNCETGHILTRFFLAVNGYRTHPIAMTDTFKREVWDTGLQWGPQFASLCEESVVHCETPAHLVREWYGQLVLALNTKKLNAAPLTFYTTSIQRDIAPLDDALIAAGLPSLHFHPCTRAATTRVCDVTSATLGFLCAVADQPPETTTDLNISLDAVGVPQRVQLTNWNDKCDDRDIDCRFQAWQCTDLAARLWHGRRQWTDRVARRRLTPRQRAAMKLAVGLVIALLVLATLSFAHHKNFIMLPKQ